MIMYYCWAKNTEHTDLITWSSNKYMDIWLVFCDNIQRNEICRGQYRIKRLHSGGTQGPNVSIYARGVLNSFLCALEGCLVNLELSEKLFIYLDVLGELWLSRKSWVAFSSHPSYYVAILMGPVESSTTWSSLAFFRKL